MNAEPGQFKDSNSIIRVYITEQYIGERIYPFPVGYKQGEWLDHEKYHSRKPCWRAFDLSTLTHLMGHLKEHLYRVDGKNPIKPGPDEKRANKYYQERYYLKSIRLCYKVKLWNSPVGFTFACDCAERALQTWVVANPELEYLIRDAWHAITAGRELASVLNDAFMRYGSDHDQLFYLGNIPNKQKTYDEMILFDKQFQKTKMEFGWIFPALLSAYSCPNIAGFAYPVTQAAFFARLTQADIALKTTSWKTESERDEINKDAWYKEQNWQGEHLTILLGENE